MLLTGDAEAEAVPMDPGPVDVLKVAHHGSEDAGLGELLDRSVPKLAVISVGAGNSYGHPTDATLRRAPRARCARSCAPTCRARSTSTRTVPGGRCTRTGDSLSAMAWVRRAGILLTVLVVALGLGGAAGGREEEAQEEGQRPGTPGDPGSPSSNQFTGAVGSKLEACRSSRVVTLFYTDPNNGLDLTPLGAAHRRQGRLQGGLPSDAFAGTYQVQVAQQTIRAHKAPQTCKAAESPAIGVQ